MLNLSAVSAQTAVVRLCDGGNASEPRITDFLVENESVDCVTEVVENEQRRLEIFPAVRLKEADDVFEHDEWRTAITERI